MAASLTELWSRLLLPADSAAARAAAAEAEALRRQLLVRARMRAAADWLQRRPQLGRDVFSRGGPAPALSGRGSDLTALLRACLVALVVPETQAAAYRPRPPPLWRVSDAIAHLRRVLLPCPMTPLAALLPAIDGDVPANAMCNRAAVASTLVAGLELARTGNGDARPDGAVGQHPAAISARQGRMRLCRACARRRPAVMAVRRQLIHGQPAG